MALALGHHLDSMVASMSGNRALYSCSTRRQYSMRALGQQYLRTN